MVLPPLPYKWRIWFTRLKGMNRKLWSWMHDVSLKTMLFIFEPTFSLAQMHLAYYLHTVDGDMPDLRPHHFGTSRGTLCTANCESALFAVGQRFALMTQWTVRRTPKQPFSFEGTPESKMNSQSDAEEPITRRRVSLTVLHRMEAGKWARLWYWP